MSKRNIVGRGKIDTTSTLIHDSSLSFLGKGNLIKKLWYGLEIKNKNIGFLIDFVLKLLYVVAVHSFYDIRYLAI